MSTDPDRRSRRLITEGVVIVASILLAFAIDASWDARGERLRERGVLESLEAEFEENLEAIRRVAEIHARDEAAAVELLEMMLTNGTPPADQNTERLLSFVYLGAVTLNVSSGALASYLSGGDSELIRNRRLRALLHGWSGLLDENAEDEQRATRQLQEVFKPFVTSEYSLVRLYDAFPESLYGDMPQEPLDSARLRRFVGHRQIRNHVALKLASVRVMQREVSRLSEAAEEMLRLIRDELDSFR